MPRRLHSEIRGPGGALPLRRDDRVAQDLALLIEGEVFGRPLDAVLQEFGCSRSAYYDKLRRFREQGLSGLVPRPPGPKGPWRSTLDVARFVVTTRLREPQRAAASIAQALRQQGMTASVRTVERTLKQFGLTHQEGVRK